MLLWELGEVYWSLLVLKRFVSLLGFCTLVQVVKKGSLSSGTLLQLPSKAPLISFLEILYMYFCTILLHFLPVDRCFSYFPDVLAEGHILLTCPLGPLLATRLQWDCPFRSVSQSFEVIPS